MQSVKELKKQNHKLKQSFSEALKTLNIRELVVVRDAYHLKVNQLIEIIKESTKGAELIEIGHKMNQAGLPEEFTAAALSTAFEFEGVYDLMNLWVEETESSERGEIIADIQDMLEIIKESTKRSNK